MRTIDYPTKYKEKASDTKHATPGSIATVEGFVRHRTDLLMCLIFIVFIAGMFGTAAYGYAKGEPSKLLTPFDSRGNQCGVAGTPTEKFKYVWWPDLN